MRTEDYKYMINSYFDGELDREKEAVLFTYLSQDEECREYFKSMNLLRTAVDKTNEEFPEQLEERILYSLQNNNENKFSFLFTNNLFAAASYAVAVILIILSVFFYSESNVYKSKLENTIQHINRQEQLLQLIMNSMPAPVVVEANQYEEVIVSSKKL